LKIEVVTNNAESPFIIDSVTKVAAKPTLEEKREDQTIIQSGPSDGPGRRGLRETGPHMGMASSAFLEPLVWLYGETGKPEYLAFGRWLVDEDESAATLHELAAEYGVSAERIRQIEVKAMQKMKGSLAAQM